MIFGSEVKLAILKFVHLYLVCEEYLTDFFDFFDRNIDVVSFLKDQLL